MSNRSMGSPGSGGFLLEYVETGAGDTLRLKVRRQGALIDQPTPGGIDEKTSRLQQRQTPGIDKMVGVAAQGTMQRHDVGRSQQVVKRQRPCAEAGCQRLVNRRIADGELQSQRPRNFDQIPADGAAPYQPEQFAVERPTAKSWPLLPCRRPGQRQTMLLDQPRGERQDERQSGDGSRAAGRLAWHDERDRLSRHRIEIAIFIADPNPDHRRQSLVETRADKCQRRLAWHRQEEIEAGGDLRRVRRVETRHLQPGHLGERSQRIAGKGKASVSMQQIACHTLGGCAHHRLSCERSRQLSTTLSNQDIHLSEIVVSLPSSAGSQKARSS